MVSNAPHVATALLMAILLSVISQKSHNNKQQQQKKACEKSHFTRTTPVTHIHASSVIDFTYCHSQ